MNTVDNLLKSPFCNLTLEEKLAIKRLGPHQPNDFSFFQMDSKKKRKFCSSWFTKKPWLTVSVEKESLFCFYCLLFDSGNEHNINGCENTWTKTGFRDLKHLSEKMKKHEESAAHLENALKYIIFGTINIGTHIDSAIKISLQRHNKEVSRNRHILGRVIDCLKFCGIHELSLRDPLDIETKSFNHSGYFLDLLSMIGNLDSTLEGHLTSSTPFKCTSHVIRNELLDCMYNVYIDDLKNDINNTDFVSVQADETTNINGMSQFVIILRFIKDCKPLERFVTLVEVQDRTANGLSEVLKNILDPFNLDKKLIALAFDSAAVTNDHRESVLTLLKLKFPNVKYVYCYSHVLDSVIKNACSNNIKMVRQFFANVSGFSVFFSTSKRIDVLHSLCSRSMPTASQTVLNFQSRVINSVMDLKNELVTSFEKIENDHRCDDTTLREVYGLKHLLQNEEFLYFLNFFNDLIKHIDILYNTVQTLSAYNLSLSDGFKQFESAINDIRLNTEKYLNYTNVDNICSPPTNKQFKWDLEENLCVTAKDVCDIIETEIKNRFQNSDIFNSFSLIDPKMFHCYREIFPFMLAKIFSSNYDTFIYKEKLINELIVIYQNEMFKNIISVCDLFRFFVQHSLQDSFSETYKALQIAITTPIATDESERCLNTLKKIKTCLKNNIGQDRLNSLVMCSVHSDLISEMTDFNNKVIDLFANQKNRRAQLHYK